MNKKKALGRGLSSFLSDNVEDINLNENQIETNLRKSGALVIPIEKLRPNPDQPRKNFNPDELRKLSETIKDKGILQPLIVVKEGKSEYMIVAGERRWRAAQMARLHELPVIVKELTSKEILEIAIIENVQRTELSSVEEAEGYLKLAEEFKYKHDKIAEIVGKSRPYISNSIRLLSLPQEVMGYVKNGELSAGHARAILNFQDPLFLARLVIKKGLSVRQTELFAKRQKIDYDEKEIKVGSSSEKDPDTVDLERSLTAQINFPTRISHDKKKNSGKVYISYKNLEELDAICDILRTKK
ncbi:MAG: ParB/RepB/Spo0J family partition protein [Paracoccaceae bacterium]|nr:ParB/RepB/Spo0J family partition protein [Paracoccaceae bacterium]